MPRFPPMPKIPKPPPPVLKQATVITKEGRTYRKPAYKVESAPPCFIIVTGPGYEDWLRAVDIAAVHLETVAT